MTTALIVDDDAQVRRALAYLLERDGMECRAATCGAEMAVMAGSADVILLNATLGRESGLELLRALRTAGPRPPVVIVTGRRDIFPQIAELAGPADDWVCKPWDAQDLVARVRLALSRARP